MKQKCATDLQLPDGVRDPLTMLDAVHAARRRSMSERLELALSWNSVAAELRAGLFGVGDTNPAGD